MVGWMQEVPTPMRALGELQGVPGNPKAAINSE